MLIFALVFQRQVLDMKIRRLTVFVVALLTPLAMTQGVATASPLTYDYSGTFDMGPLTGTSYTGTFIYDTAGNPNLQTNIPLTFSLFSNYDTHQIEAHPSGIPLFTLVDRLGGSRCTSASLTSYPRSSINRCHPSSSLRCSSLPIRSSRS